MKQRTIAKQVELVGIGLHKGVPVKMVLEPMPAGSGVIFNRSDLGVDIPLERTHVIDTTMATTLGSHSNPQARISTVEHLLSAISAYGIDNLKIRVDNEEIPIMDGSAIAHCMLLDEAGIAELEAPKPFMRITKEVGVEEGPKFVKISPDSSLSFDFGIDFSHPAIDKQHYRFTFSRHAYKEQIAKARTFGFLQEVNYLRSIGLAKGGSLNNCIVLDEHGIVNKEGLRYEEEFVRHKILDAMGDLAFLGMSVVGAYQAYMGSHKLNAQLVQKVLESRAYEIVYLTPAKSSEQTQSLEMVHAYH
ncbi:UDP-3-O-acyl-N-acetylglucosamine deacetylase [Helicobacter ailurogastricus]|uniref:UDP-3-O-acyl-N-acetylglucosamine deacetylase n=1 Tax=Helicobacter ailurogastricus TaxID=1578720 RepID=A0A0K2XDM5_9HELI|nr:UDP-3-O-acyl-N-acetylglucosamine deacetylase [Helicobacter ailurogastricus]CRF40350.1 UDP-3-O-[3-hydroxymyristoyl] N-acetylglucosamine deacetylase [Helicobacter ailurogastricus]CRF42417.1 UDP-3-O-[3-hydroxymyristoyl] N-acetylglucosamine deacetylase [Helicobacter ailurogastricus]CRF44642.1 UDP-3-O-[3-hydroxymyristoyl] N-acetylglucosamine deacetylase [Helicobacter ailurogastricus]